MTKNTEEPVSIRFTRDTTHLEGENDMHKMGEVYECTPAQAQAWLDRAAAVLVSDEHEDAAKPKKR